MYTIDQEWKAAIMSMTHTRYDETGNKIQMEKIPQPSASSTQIFFNSGLLTGNVAVNTHPWPGCETKSAVPL